MTFLKQKFRLYIFFFFFDCAQIKSYFLVKNYLIYAKVNPFLPEKKFDFELKQFYFKSIIFQLKAFFLQVDSVGLLKNYNRKETNLYDCRQRASVDRVVQIVAIGPSQRLVSAVVGLEYGPVEARQWSPSRFSGSGQS